MITRLKHIQRIAAKGRIYYYHRPTKTRIQAAYGTAAFIVEVTRLNLALESAAPMPGTLGSLMAAYRASPEFEGRAERTRADYNSIMNWLKKVDDKPLSEITPSFAIGLRDKAYAKKGLRFANYVVTFGALLFKWATPRELVSANPFTDITHLRKPHGTPHANRSWSMLELKAFLDAANPGIRAAVALGAYAGLREGDALILPWSAYKGGVITYRQGKTGDRVEVPAHRDLVAILAQTPRKGTVIVTGQRGLPMTIHGFLTMFKKARAKLLKEGAIGEGLTYHGLRHTAATMLADAGCDTRDIMSVTGHRTESVVSVYTRTADRKRRAASAVDRLEKAQTANAECKTSAKKV